MAKLLNEKVFRLDGDVAVVTGGGGDIGGAICRIFSGAGAHVACLDYDLAKACATAESINAAGGHAIGIRCDVGVEQDVLASVAQTHRELGAPTVLVNCAATLDKSGTTLDIDVEEWERVHRVNLTGTFMMSKAVLAHMVDAGRGSIIHIASRLAHVGWPGRTAYSSTKAAVAQMARSMAIDHAAQGIRVNSISPGTIETARVAFRFGDQSEEDRKKRFARFPLGRAGQPDEVAAAALFLASEASSFVTGTDLVVDGGVLALG